MGKPQKGSRSVTFHVMLKTLCLRGEKVFKWFIKSEKKLTENQKNKETLGIAPY